MGQNTEKVLQIPMSTPRTDWLLIKEMINAIYLSTEEQLSTLFVQFAEHNLIPLEALRSECDRNELEITTGVSLIIGC